MKKLALIGGFLLAGILFAQKYEYKEPGFEYQRKEPPSSKFLRINALEIKMGKMDARVRELEAKVSKLESQGI
ncbi:MAG: hypothetical protein E2O68_03850 [Deltaproteobacteria bacterium]|nr:MAG: hypothetical protein E2O68_03850 [Deltaproteobacteria bacterium]